MGERKREKRKKEREDWEIKRAKKRERKILLTVEKIGRVVII